MDEKENLYRELSSRFYVKTPTKE